MFIFIWLSAILIGLCISAVFGPCVLWALAGIGTFAIAIVLKVMITGKSFGN